ncbi:hypothetical protein LCGC14_0361850, partial [marine sediment metagenome]
NIVLPPMSEVEKAVVMGPMSEAEKDGYESDFVLCYPGEQNSDLFN